MAILTSTEKDLFLTPLLYSISALAHIPVLYFAAILQHLFGVVLVVCTGLLTKAWFLSWRLWIVPLTVLIAINPILLWYEHTALPESMTVFGAMAVALTGTLFFGAPTDIRSRCCSSPSFSWRGLVQKGAFFFAFRPSPRHSSVLGRLVSPENLCSGFSCLGVPDLPTYPNRPERNSCSTRR